MPPATPRVQDRDSLIGLQKKINRLKVLETREDCQNDLRYFVEQAWPHIDPSPFMSFWGLDAVCDHLEAVMMGQIPRLLINIPPRCSKTTIVSIMFPAWIWLRFNQISPLSGPQVRFLCASYSDKLSLLSSNAFRRLVKSEWYQSLYPELSFMRDQDAKGHMDNNKRGSRQSTSVGGSLLGLGGDILIGDDLNNTETEKLVETGAERTKVKGFFDEFRSTRLNDPREGKSALIGVQQRTNEEDMSGHWLDSGENIVHLMIPMRHDPQRHNVTIVLPQYEELKPWEDPRDAESEDLMWEDRFGEYEVSKLEKALGPIMAAGRLQQSPKAKGGNIIMRDYWKLWDAKEAQKYGLQWDNERREFPRMELVVASLDTAMKEKEENDFSALSVWGIFLDAARNRRAMLMFSWQKRLPLNGVDANPLPNELPVHFEKRKKDSWGLVQWVADTCKRYKVKRLLIENKTRGHDVANEIKRQYARENWGVQLLEPVGDKVSRAHATVPLFADSNIYAPDTKWAEQMIANCESFPKAAHDDLLDTTTQFLDWARDVELLTMVEEFSAAQEELSTFQHRTQSVSEQYGVG